MDMRHAASVGSLVWALT